ncbi:hypothetical protein [Arthrobacter sp. SLBN-83]|uniref:hypothetical protein n=1 Tax=Arthrobacter sp. SLBN-83 TaxID=2768449 RepID=UPI001F23EB77|nr:hypothetical protein [Arthrobacter sp. SLBN-83]
MTSDPIGPALTSMSRPVQAARTAHPVHGDGQRFRQRPAEGVHAVWKETHLGCLRKFLFAEAAVGVGSNAAEPKYRICG